MAALQSRAQRRAVGLLLAFVALPRMLAAGTIADGAVVVALWILMASVFVRRPDPIPRAIVRAARARALVGAVFERLGRLDLARPRGLLLPSRMRARASSRFVSLRRPTIRVAEPRDHIALGRLFAAAGTDTRTLQATCNTWLDRGRMLVLDDCGILRAAIYVGVPREGTRVVAVAPAIPNASAAHALDNLV